MSARRLRTRLAAGVLLGSALLASSGAHAGLTNGAPPRAAAITPRPDLPEANCFTDDDGDDDAGKQATSVNGGYRVLPNDLEIDNVYVGTQKGSLLFYTRFNRYVTSSNAHFGPRVDATMRLGATRVRLTWAEPNGTYGTVTRARNKPEPTFPFASTMPATANLFETPVVRSDWIGAERGTEQGSTKTYVMIWIPLATLGSYDAVGAARDVQVTDIQVEAKLLTTSAVAPNETNNASQQTNWNDNDLEIDVSPEGTSTGSTADPKIIYTIGSDPQGCLPTPVSLLSRLTGTTTYFSDEAELSAKLTLADGTTPLAGKQVTFSIAGKSVTEETDEDGIVEASMAHGKVAGRYPLTVRFAGDTEGKADTLTGTLVVHPEKASFTTPTVTRSGTARIVTVTLKDNDGTLVARTPVQWYANGTRVAQSTTDSKGRASYRGRAGQSVYALLPASTKYATAKSRTVRL